MATTSLWHIKGRRSDLIAYVENPEKTVPKGTEERSTIHKIIVHAPDKSSGHRRQKIENKAAGMIDIADDLCEAGDGRGQWRKTQKTA